MQIISLQKKLTLFIISIIFLALIVVLLIIIPALKQINELKTSITATEQFVEEQYLKTQHLKSSVRHLDEIKKQIEKFSNITVSQNDQLKIITELENLATEHNITQYITVKFIDDVTHNENLIKLPYYEFSFVNSGKFLDQFNYFKSLEKLDYYVTIDNLQLDNQGNSPESETVARFNAHIYAKPI
ncbi:hypothetical protein KJ641_00425 [Patescibacteria group bacterium]|nr:hypothetical protein [Patescibacteria group bacterium]